jgi:hypothetical protein
VFHNRETGQVKAWHMNGATIVSPRDIGTQSDVNWVLLGVADFNNDQRSDLVWRHRIEGTVLVWLLTPTAYTEVAVGPAVPSQLWRIVAAADFDGDGYADLLWHHQTTGEVLVWKLSSGSKQSQYSLGFIGPNWELASIGNFDALYGADIVWRKQVSGEVLTWPIVGLQVGTPQYAAPAPQYVADEFWRLYGRRDH